MLLIMKNHIACSKYHHITSQLRDVNRREIRLSLTHRIFRREIIDNWMNSIQWSGSGDSKIYVNGATPLLHNTNVILIIGKTRGRSLPGNCAVHSIVISPAAQMNTLHIEQCSFWIFSIQKAIVNKLIFMKIAQSKKSFSSLFLLVVCISLLPSFHPFITYNMHNMKYVRISL